MFYTKSKSRRTQGYNVKVGYLEDNLSAWGESITGNFSIVGLRISFEGRAKQYIFNYFVPITMFTLTSWFSYLLPVNVLFFFVNRGLIKKYAPKIS